MTTVTALEDQVCTFLESQGAKVDFIHDHLNERGDFGVEFTCPNGVDGVVQYRTQDDSYYESIDGEEATYDNFDSLVQAWK